MTQNAGLFVLHILAFNAQQHHLRCIAGGRSLGTYTHISCVTEYMRVGRNPMAVIWKLLTRKEISENAWMSHYCVLWGPLQLNERIALRRKSHYVITHLQSTWKNISPVSTMCHSKWFGYRHSSEYIILCSTEESHTFRTWRWVIDENLHFR